MFSWMSAIKDAIAFLDKKGLTNEINMVAKKLIILIFCVG